MSKYLDVWMSHDELSKRRIKREAIDTISSAKNKLQQINYLHEIQILYLQLQKIYLMEP